MQVGENEFDEMAQDIVLAEHKLDQYLQGQVPGQLRAGVALNALRRVLVALERMRVLPPREKKSK